MYPHYLDVVLHGITVENASFRFSLVGHPCGRATKSDEITNRRAYITLSSLLSRAKFGEN